MAAKRDGEAIPMHTTVDVPDEMDDGTRGFRLEVSELRELMEFRGHEAVETIAEKFGGVTSICARLNTDEINGKHADLKLHVYGNSQTSKSPCSICVLR
mgnify:FL=1